jgi:nucleotide-binding universal stress UspA family protein
MTSGTVLVATDGSDLALSAAVDGFAVLRPPDRVVVVTMIEADDISLVVGGSGLAGGVMSAEEYDAHRTRLQSEAQTALQETVAALGIEGVETMVREGDAGRELCDLADELSATAIVMGSRGRGGIKRAFLGSVSDYVVRNARCTVVISKPAE